MMTTKSMKLLFAIVLIPLSTVSSGVVFAADKSALVIGNAAYNMTVGPLLNPVQDAEGVAMALADAGFSVMRAKNAPIDDLRSIIREFLDVSRDSGLAVLYYSGHGVQIEGQAFLPGIDIPSYSNRNVIESGSLSVSTLIRQMSEASPNGAKVILLDACRTSPAVAASEGIDLGLPDPQFPDDTGSGLIIQYAAQFGRTADDGFQSAGRSPYAQALIANLKEPGVTVADVLERTALAVDSATSKAQRPASSGQIYEHDLVFRSRPEIHLTSIGSEKLGWRLAVTDDGQLLDIKHLARRTIDDQWEDALTCNWESDGSSRARNGFVVSCEFLGKSTVEITGTHNAVAIYSKTDSTASNVILPLVESP